MPQTWHSIGTPDLNASSLCSNEIIGNNTDTSRYIISVSELDLLEHVFAGTRFVVEFRSRMSGPSISTNGGHAEM